MAITAVKRHDGNRSLQAEEVCPFEPKTKAEIHEEIKQGEMERVQPSIERFDLQNEFPQATDLALTEEKFTPGTAAFIGEVTEAESVSMIKNLSRYAGWASDGLAALGPVFDIAALGFWAYDLEKTFTNADSSTLDKVGSVLFLIPGVK